jgi:DNA-binding MarR family transcriptional regulator
MRFRGKGPVFALISMDALLSSEFDKLSKSAVKLLLYLHGTCYGGPAQIRPQDISQFELGEILTCSTKTVSRAVSELEKARYLEVEREWDGFQNRKVNVYNLTGESLPYHRTNLSGNGAQNRTSLSESRGTYPGDNIVSHTKETDLTTDGLPTENYEMSDYESKLYDEMLGFLVERIGHQDTTIWFRSAKIETGSDFFTLHTGDTYFSEWILDNYLESILEFLDSAGLSERVVKAVPLSLSQDGPLPD